MWRLVPPLLLLAQGAAGLVGLFRSAQCTALVLPSGAVSSSGAGLVTALPSAALLPGPPANRSERAERPPNSCANWRCSCSGWDVTRCCTARPPLLPGRGDLRACAAAAPGPPAAAAADAAATASGMAATCTPCTMLCRRCSWRCPSTACWCTERSTSASRPRSVSRPPRLLAAVASALSCRLRSSCSSLLRSRGGRAPRGAQAGGPGLRVFSIVRTAPWDPLRWP